MADSPTTPQHPFVAMLPPKTDPATYLIMLEYNLSRQNLPLLNTLLEDGSGTLANDIGWDLAGVVLPFVDQGDKEAERCMLTVAQRGNPREVILAVAAELEKIAQGTIESADGFEAQDDTKEVDDNQSNKQSYREATDFTNRCICLMTMLKFLQPRIQTQYPSRFLATTLPAAVSAFRTVPNSIPVTKAIVSLLSALSGRQKPVLPPRRSQTSSSTLSSNPPNVSLPDPEAASTNLGMMPKISQLQKNISQKLLQAGYTEVVEAFFASMYGDDTVLSEKEYATDLSRLFQAASQTDTTNTALRNKKLVAFSLFDQCSKLLDLNVSEALTERVEGMEVAADGTQSNDKSTELDEEVSEYPTSVAQIELSLEGLIELYAVELMIMDPDLRRPDLRFASRLLIATNHPDFDKSNTPPLSKVAQAACLTILSEALRGRYESWIELPKDMFLSLMESLCQIFKTSLDATFRKSSLGAATHMLHEYSHLETRLHVIKRMARNQSLDDSASQGSFRPPVVTAGALKAVGIDWLKEEILIVVDKTETVATINAPIPPPNSVEGLPVTLLTDNKAGVYELVVQHLTTEFVMVSQNELSRNDAASVQFEIFVENASMLVRCVNLLHVLVARSGLPGASQGLKSVVTSVMARPETIEYISKLSTSVKWILEGLNSELLSLDDAQRMDVWSLEDALIRLDTAIKKNQAPSA